MIHSLSSSWETINQNLTHNEKIKTFDYLAHNLELKAERLEAMKPIVDMAKSRS
jgi:hypothetical protein